MSCSRADVLGIDGLRLQSWWRAALKMPQLWLNNDELGCFPFTVSDYLTNSEDGCWSEKKQQMWEFSSGGKRKEVSDRYRAGQSCRAHVTVLHYQREKRGNEGEMKQRCFITAINLPLIASLLSPTFVQDYEWIEFPLKSDGSMSSIIRDFVIRREKSKSIKICCVSSIGANQDLFDAWI